MGFVCHTGFIPGDNRVMVQLQGCHQMNFEAFKIETLGNSGIKSLWLANCTRQKLMASQIFFSAKNLVNLEKLDRIHNFQTSAQGESSLRLRQRRALKF